MQSMVRQLEYYKFNALLILLTTFLTHEQYFRVFGITVNPHDSLSTSTVSYSDGFVGNAAAHHINNYDYNIEFINGPNKFTGSAEAVSISEQVESVLSTHKYTYIENKNMVYLFKTSLRAFDAKSCSLSDNPMSVIILASLTFCIKCD